MNKTAVAGIGLFFSLLFPSVGTAQTVLQEIQQNGVLRVGIRKDAAPFGYMEGNNWKGLCVVGMELFRASLERQLNRPVRLEQLETSLDESADTGRFRSVANKRTHLECGPNTILRNPPSQITYSLPFLYSGTNLLVKSENKLIVKPSGFLQNITIGVLDNSLTQQFINGRYQLANQRTYQGSSGRERGVKDAVEGKIEAFASDGMLLLGEALRQGLNPAQYAIIPDQPLTCVSYGMILPDKDAEWKETVNKFIQNQSITDLIERQFGNNSPFIPMSILAQDRCS